MFGLMQKAQEHQTEQGKKPATSESLISTVEQQIVAPLGQIAGTLATAASYRAIKSGLSTSPEATASHKTTENAKLVEQCVATCTDAVNQHRDATHTSTMSMR